MKSLLICILMLSLAFLPGANASHLIGGNITYEYTTVGTVFRLKLYRDCNGIPLPLVAPICFTSPSGCAPDTNVDLNLVSFIEVPFNSCAGLGTTSCNGGSIHSFEEYTYEGVAFPSACSDWIISINFCCRNMASTNLINNALTTLSVETTMDNLNYPTNSSPAFNTTPVNYYCVGIPAMIDYSATDIDGDSLVYEFVEVLEGQCGATVSIPYQIPYTFDQPIASSPPAFLDSLGGQILFTPSIIQNSVVGFRVKEYRNGVLIATVRRDDAIVAVNGFSPVDTIAGRVFFDMNLDSVFNSGDVPAGNLMVQVGPGIDVTSSIGKYDIVVPPASYTISLPNLPLYMTQVTTSYAVTTTGTGTFYGNNDFALQPIPGKNDLTISINSSIIPNAGLSYPLYINYENVGTTIQNNVDISVTIDNSLTFLSAFPPPTSSVGNVYTWNIPTLNVFGSGPISIQTLVDSSVPAGIQVTCQASISSSVMDETPLDNLDSLTAIAQNLMPFPYDPNYKEVLPAGDLPLSFITSQQWLHYKINFQNTGTGFAQVVKINDLLDFDLDFGSLELVSGSFPCTLIMQNLNEIEFTFFGINLPPATIDEPGSHGFVEYRIKPKSTVPVGSFITNSADIKFDLNTPISTNLVHSKVVLTTGLNDVTTTDLAMVVYPNPAEDFVTLSVTNSISEKVTIAINNLMGQTVFEKLVYMVRGENNIEIPLMNMESGIYMLNVIKRDDSGVLRLVVK